MASDFQGNKRKQGIGFVHAWNGFKKVVKSERNFRLQLGMALTVAVLGLVFRISSLEWLLVLLASTLVLCLEMVNTALEKLLDYLAPHYHPQAGMIKDISAGAVLLATLFAAIIGGVIFIPEVFQLLVDL